MHVFRHLFLCGQQPDPHLFLRLSLRGHDILRVKLSHDLRLHEVTLCPSLFSLRSLRRLLLCLATSGTH